LTLGRSINLYMQGFPRSKDMFFFPWSFETSADIGPPKYTGCGDSFPLCHLHSNGDGIWSFATCEAVQIWDWRDVRRLCQGSEWCKHAQTHTLREDTSQATEQ
jgi:hypothetical protein